MKTCMLDQPSYITYLVNEALKEVDKTDGASESTLVSSSSEEESQVPANYQDNSLGYRGTPRACNGPINFPLLHPQPITDFTGLYRYAPLVNPRYPFPQHPQPLNTQGLLPCPIQTTGLVPSSTIAQSTLSCSLYDPPYLGNPDSGTGTGFQNSPVSVSDSFRLNQPIDYNTTTSHTKYQLNNTIQVQYHFGENDRFALQSRDDSVTDSGSAPILEEDSLYPSARPVDSFGSASSFTEFGSGDFNDFTQFNVPNFTKFNSSVYNPQTGLNQLKPKRKYTRRGYRKSNTLCHPVNITSLYTRGTRATPPVNTVNNTEEETPRKDFHAESRQYYKLFTLQSKSKLGEPAARKDFPANTRKDFPANTRFNRSPRVTLQSAEKSNQEDSPRKDHHADIREYYKHYLESLQRKKDDPTVIDLTSSTDNFSGMAEKTFGEMSKLDLQGISIQCGVCSMDFESPSELETHMMIHSDFMESIASCLCGTCGQEFGSLADLDSHLDTHKAEVLEDSPQKRDYHNEARQYFQKSMELTEKQKELNKKKEAEVAARVKLILDLANKEIIENKQDTMCTSKRGKKLIGPKSSLKKRKENTVDEDILESKRNETETYDMSAACGAEISKMSQAKNCLMNPSKGKQRQAPARSSSVKTNAEEDKLLKKFGIRHTKVCLKRVLGGVEGDDEPSMENVGRKSSRMVSKQSDGIDKSIHQVAEKAPATSDKTVYSKLSKGRPKKENLSDKINTSAVSEYDYDNESDIEIIEKPIELVVIDSDDPVTGNYNSRSPQKELFGSDFEMEIDLQTKFGNNEEDSALLKRFGIKDIAIKLDKVETRTNVNIASDTSNTTAKTKETCDRDLMKKFGLKDIGIRLDKITNQGNTPEKKKDRGNSPEKITKKGNSPEKIRNQGNSPEKIDGGKGSLHKYFTPFNRRHYVKATISGTSLNEANIKDPITASNTPNKKLEEMSPADLENLLKQCGMGITVPGTTLVSKDEEIEGNGVKSKVATKRSLSPQMKKGKGSPLVKRKYTGTQPSSPQPSTSKGYSRPMKRTARKSVRDQELIDKYKLKEPQIIVKSLSKIEISLLKNPHSPFGKSDWLKHKFDLETESDGEWDLPPSPLLLATEDESDVEDELSRAKKIVPPGNIKDTVKALMMPKHKANVVAKTKKFKGVKSNENTAKEKGNEDAEMMKKFGIFESKVIVVSDVKKDSNESFTDADLLKKFGMTEAKVEVENPQKDIFTKLKGPVKAMSPNKSSNSIGKCESKMDRAKINLNRAFTKADDVTKTSSKSPRKVKNIANPNTVNTKQKLKQHLKQSKSKEKSRSLQLRPPRSCKFSEKVSLAGNGKPNNGGQSSNDGLINSAKVVKKKKTTMEKLKAKSILRAIETGNRNRNKPLKFTSRKRKQVGGTKDDAVVMIDNLTDADVESMKNSLKGVGNRRKDASSKQTKLSKKLGNKKTIAGNIKRPSTPFTSNKSKKTKSKENSRDRCTKLSTPAVKNGDGRLLSTSESSKYADILKESHNLKVTVPCLTDDDIAKLTRKMSNGGNEQVTDIKISGEVEKESYSRVDTEVKSTEEDIKMADTDTKNTHFAGKIDEGNVEDINTVLEKTDESISNEMDEIKDKIKDKAVCSLDARVSAKDNTFEDKDGSVEEVDEHNANSNESVADSTSLNNSLEDIFSDSMSNVHIETDKLNNTFTENLSAIGSNESEKMDEIRSKNEINTIGDCPMSNKISQENVNKEENKSDCLNEKSEESQGKLDEVDGGTDIVEHEMDTKDKAIDISAEKMNTSEENLDTTGKNEDSLNNIIDKNETEEVHEADCSTDVLSKKTSKSGVGSKTTELKATIIDSTSDSVIGDVSVYDLNESLHKDKMQSDASETNKSESEPDHINLNDTNAEKDVEDSKKVTIRGSMVVDEVIERVNEENTEKES